MPTEKYMTETLDIEVGPPMSIWHPASAGHVIDPRIRERLLADPDLTIVMVHRAAMASANPCWLILRHDGARIVSRLKFVGSVEAIQMAPSNLGTFSCAWLETHDPVIVLAEDRGGVEWEEWPT